MKLKEITIGVRSLKDGLNEFGRVIKAIQRGHPPRARKPGIYFVDYNAMHQVLTPRRMELLHLIRERNPGSIYELPHMADRNVKNVQDDVALLERLGLIHVTHQRTYRRRSVPHVDYDTLNLKVSFAHMSYAA
jgi:predicted transcriptional regulator